MVLHNNYYIDDTEKINFFRYENLENFDLASSITEKIQFNNDLLLKLENVDWKSIDLKDICFYHSESNNTILIKINNLELTFRFGTEDTLLTILIFYISIGKGNDYLQNIEKLYESRSFYTIDDIRNFYDNNVSPNFINFVRLILNYVFGGLYYAGITSLDEFDFSNLDSFYSWVEDGADHFDRYNSKKRLRRLIRYYKQLDDILDNNSNNIFVVMVAKEKNMYKKYFYFFSKKNKLLLDKYDRLINIEEELYFFNNLIDKIPYYKENKILECIENKCLKYIDKLIKENNLLKGIHLLNYLLSFNGSTRLRKFKLFFHPTLMDKFIHYYFKIFYELQEYEMIFDYYHLIENDIKTLQIVSDSYIQISKYDEALKILDKIEIMEPTLKYLQTTRNKINREQKINSFSNKNDKIDNMTGIEFEKLLTDKFNELNFIATQTKGSGDFGADIIVETSNQTKIIIQCKRFTSKVNLKAVQEVIGAVGHFEADIGIVITNNEFLNSAIKLAKSNDIELWDRAKLAKFLNNDISFSILNEV